MADQPVNPFGDAPAKTATPDQTGMSNPFETGASVTAPAAGAGGSYTEDIAHQPASLSGVAKTLTSKEGLKAVADPLIGFVKGLGDTVHGTGELIRKGGNIASDGLGDKIVPPVGQKALETSSESDNGAQWTGKALENVAEYMSGEGALNAAGKALSIGERVKKLGDVAVFLEKHPFIAKMIVGGAKSGAVVGAQTTAKTGSPVEGAEAGAVAVPLGMGAEAVGSGVKRIRELYKPLIDVNSGTKDVLEAQPIVQKGIRTVLSDVAKNAGIKESAAASVRDVASETADQIASKHQPVFQAVDKASNGAFSDAQAAARKYKGAIDKAGKDAFDAALKKQNNLFEKFVKGQIGQGGQAFSPQQLEEAKAGWRQYRALQEVDDAINASTRGQHPTVAAASKNPQTKEVVNSSGLHNRLMKLYKDGTLETALGKNGANDLLDHVGHADQAAKEIAFNNAKTKAANKAANEAKKRGRMVVAGTGAVLGTGGLVTAAEHASYKGIKSALSGH